MTWRALIGLAVFATVLFADTPNYGTPFHGPIRVEIPPDDGAFVFSEIKLYHKSDLFGWVPRMFAEVSNETSHRWEKISFQFRVYGRNADGAPEQAAFEYVNDSRRLAGEKGHASHEFRAMADLPLLMVDKIEIEFTGGYKLPNAAEIAIKEAAAERAAEAKAKAQAVARAKQRESAKRTAEYLLSLPVLRSGSTNAFVGNDRKCAVQFMEAAALDGLDKRKRIADLLSFGCGFISDSGVPTQVSERTGGYSLVKILGGKAYGKSGWVPDFWIHGQ